MKRIILLCMSGLFVLFMTFVGCDDDVPTGACEYKSYKDYCLDDMDDEVCKTEGDTIEIFHKGKSCTDIGYTEVCSWSSEAKCIPETE